MRYATVLGALTGMLTTAALLAGCGGGGGGDAAAPAATQAQPSGNDSAPDPVARSGPLYDRDPILASCDPGVLKASEKQLALKTLNEMRAAHGLPAVTYDTSGDVYTRQAALLGVVNQTLTHTPTPQARCFTSDGLLGAQTSNLYLRWGIGETDVTTPSALASLLIDDGVASLGHRRWMLSPFLGSTSYGRVDGYPIDGIYRFTGVAFSVTGGLPASPAGSRAAKRGFIAYPDGDYPAAWFKQSVPMSFTVLANPGSAAANDARSVSFEQASITIRNAEGRALEILDRTTDYTGYGVPNVVQWRAPSTEPGASYDVSVANVLVNGARRDYTYSFRVTP